jgi:hypothetical protein
MCDRIVLVLLFLTFKGDGNTICKFKVGMCVRDDLSVLEETNIPHAKLFRLALFCLQDFKIFARSKCKEHAQSCELDDGLVEFRVVALQGLR